MRRQLFCTNGTGNIMIKPASLKLIILDCDGVLYPTDQLPFQHFIKALKKTWDQFHIPDETIQKAKIKRNKAGYTGIYNHIFFVAKETKIPFEILVDYFIEQIDYSGLKKNIPLKEHLTVLNKKIPCCIVTNNHNRHLDIILKQVFDLSTTDSFLPKIDISNRFDGIGFLSKKNPNCFLKICEQFSVHPEDTLCADDTPTILKIAKSIGLKTLLISQQLPLYPQLNDCLKKLRQKD